jgi:hypothetical protein
MTPLDARLATLAARGETISYGALARELGLRIGVLTAALEASMEADAVAGRPFRAAICAARLSPDALPAPGFFAKAAALGRPAEDPATFVSQERARLQRAPG